jgi:oxygen-independent coproporphyrinogen-3 oxidase
VERLQVPHVSVYMLEVDEESRLGLEILNGGARYGAGDIPEDDAIADFYEIAVERLRAIGIERYEISNFARPGFESVHNLKYWKREPYLAFGADAHSFDGTMRWQNPETPAEFVKRGLDVPQKTPADEKSERLFLGLRLAEGVQAEGSELSQYEQDGLIERIGGRVRLTSRGVLLSNEVFQAFV